MIISNVESMENFGKELALTQKRILLHGDLWAGKTHLIKWFAKGLWIDPQKVISPTYTYFYVYDEKLLHIDMYRLASSWDFIEKWLLETIMDYEYIAIERPKFQHMYTDESWLEIFIEKISENDRQISYGNN